MKTKTLTRADITTAIFNSTEINLPAAKVIVDAVFNEMIAMIVEHKALKVSGFGTFHQRRKKQRIGRNPKTGSEAKIAARSVISFTPSTGMKKDVNEALRALC